MFANLIRKIVGKKNECSLCDIKTNSHEEWKKHIITEEHKENMKVEEIAWRQIFEDILLIA